MALYALVTVVTVALAYYVVPHETITTYRTTRAQAVSRVSLFAIFTILFLLSALRVEVGNDYKNYAITCHEIWVNGYVVTEPGFNALVKVIYTLMGGEFYVAVFAFFGFVTPLLFLYIFRKTSKDFFMSMFLFMTLGIYFRTFNTVRYYFVLAVALFSLSLVAKKKYIAFVLFILLAATFHKSVLFVIPVYLVAAYIGKKYHYYLMMLLSCLLFVGKDVVMWVALKLYPSYQNTEFVESTGNIFSNLPGIIQCVLVLVLGLIFYEKTIQNDDINRICFNLNIMAVLLLTCGYYIPLLSRFTYYLTIPHLLLIPGIIAGMDAGKKKYLVIGLTVIICVIYFLMFLRTADAPGIRVLPYKTWIMDGLQEYVYANELS